MTAGKSKENTEKITAVKEEVKAAKNAAEKVVKETAAKAEKAVKATAKTAKAKTQTVKKAVKESISKDEIILQLSGRDDINLDKVVEDCKTDYKAKGHRAPKSVCVYVKPEEGVAYYTVNGKGSEEFKVEL